MKNSYLKIFATFLIILNSSFLDAAKKGPKVETYSQALDPWASIPEEFKFSFSEPTFAELLTTYWDKYDNVLRGDITGGRLGGTRPEFRYLGTTFYKYYNELRDKTNLDPFFIILNKYYPLFRPRYSASGAESYTVPFAWEILGLDRNEKNKKNIDKKVEEIRLKVEANPNREAIMDVVNAAAEYLKNK